MDKKGFFDLRVTLPLGVVAFESVFGIRVGTVWP